MTIGWTLLGTFGQRMLAYLLFMRVVFPEVGLSVAAGFIGFK